MSECECPLNGFCVVRNIKMKPTLQAICQRDKSRVDRMFVKPVKPVKAVRKSNSGYGTHLLKAFELALGRPIGCGSCKNVLLSFNSVSKIDVDEAELKIHLVGLEIPNSIVPRGPERLTGIRQWIRGIIENTIVAVGAIPRGTRAVTPYLPLVSVPIDRSKLQSHIMYHIMPLSGDTEWVWRRHCDWLREVRHQFNGRLIVGIVTPGDQDAWSYCPPDTVVEALSGLDAEFITAPNDTGNRKNRKHARQGKGEGVLFPQMLEKLQTSDLNHVAFYGHAKGVTRPQTPLGSPIHLWAEAMFETVFRNHNAAVNALDTHGICGSFRMPGGYRDGGPGIGSNPFFSGTFFAMRLVDVFVRNWQYLPTHYGCVEQWPRLNFEMQTQAACLFFDNVTNLYDDAYWRSEVTPAFEQWKQARGVTE